MYRVLVNDELFSDSRIDELAIIDPIVTMEVNKAGGFTFTVPPAHPFYDKLELRKSYVYVYRDDEEEPLFDGYISSISEDLYTNKLIECEGCLAFLNDSILRPHYYSGETSRTLLVNYINIHNTQVDEKRRFTVGEVTAKDTNDSIYCYTNWESTIQEINEDLLEDIGGYIRVRHENGTRYIDYLKDSINTSTQVIRLGENLLDYMSNIDVTELATCVIPLGAVQDNSSISGLDEYLTIKSVNDGLDFVKSDTAVAKLGRIFKTVHFDQVTTAQKLKQKGEKYLTETQFDNVVITANALDLHYDNNDYESFKLLDKVRVISEPHGLDKYFLISAVTYNLNAPENDKFTLGQSQNMTFTKRAYNNEEEIKKKVDAVQSSSLLESAKNNASQLISDSVNGYVTLEMDDDGNPKELLIMDTKDKNTATRVWRWNVNGLGYSGTGYEGTYGTAITMDGSIVADYITTGTLSTDRLRGKIKAGSEVTIEWEAVEHPDYPDENTIKTIIGSTYISTNMITTNGGSIAGWNIADDALYKGSNTFGDENSYYFGSQGISIGDYFRVSSKGVFQASKMFEPSQYKDSDWIDLADTLTVKRGENGNGQLAIFITNVDSVSDLVNDVYIMFDLTEKPSASTYYKEINSVVLFRMSQLLQAGVAFYGSVNSYDTDSIGELSLQGYIDMSKTYQILIGLDYALNLNFGTAEGTVINKIRIGYDFNTHAYDAGTYYASMSKAIYESEGKNYEVKRGANYQICGVSFYDTNLNFDEKSSIFPLERPIGNIFDTISGKIIEENIMLDKNGLTLYDDATVKGIYTTSTDTYNYATFYEISKNKMLHTQTYKNATSTSGAKALYIKSDGTIIASSSSQRFKTDISYNTAMFDCEALYNLPIASFRYRDEYGGKDGDIELGLIAETVANVFPVAAVYDENGIIESWNERTLLPAMLKLLQLQHGDIEKLKEKVEKLERGYDNGKY